METLQLRSVQVSSSAYCGGQRKGKQQLSSKNAVSLVSVVKLQSLGGNASLCNNQNNNLLLFKEASFPAHRIRCCAPTHPPLNDCLPAVTYSNKENVKVHDEDTLLLKRRGAQLVSDLRGTCIYLIGMMGSGKSTVGKVLADALGYHFLDSDKVIEEAAGGVSVAEFFKQQDEMSFRNAETQVLKQLSCNLRLVVATGGGIVVKPENWSYMRHGVTVWLDVPLESLAERVVKAGTDSRPLLGVETRVTSAYTQALEKLTTIYENREACYANADIKLSCQKLATSLGYQVCDLTPTLIAMQILEEINELVMQKKRNDKGLDAKTKVGI